MAALLHRLGGLAARRARLFLAGWLLLIAAVVALGVLFPGSLSSSSSIPGSPAQAALDRMDAHFPSSDTQSADLVVEAPPGASWTDPVLQEELRQMLANVGAAPGVQGVDEPRVSDDGSVAAAGVAFTTPSSETVPAAQLDGVRAAARPLEATGAQVFLGGDAFEVEGPPVSATELVGVVVALIVLVLTFGSLVAAGLPLLTALVGVALTATGMLGVASVVDVSENAPVLSIMLGLAVGIDYALFIVSRHRAQLARGLTVHASIARATASAGSAVVFAGVTVIIALAGLAVARVPMLTSMGLAARWASARRSSSRCPRPARAPPRRRQVPEPANCGRLSPLPSVRRRDEGCRG
jgi:RND superfamily putative drug exporter